MQLITHKGIKNANEPFRIVDKQEFLKSINSLPEGIYNIIVKKWYKKATRRQFKYLYGLVYPRSMTALNYAGYEFTDIDQVDFFWKDLFANKKIVNRETGEIMKLPLTKREFLTIDEMTYCDAIRNYCSEYLNTNIPDPDPNWKLHKGNETN